MLAYRHAFHAGNHADVLKHLVLTQVLRHMLLKPSPFTLIDTHAGAGAYTLAGHCARKRTEHHDGIARLWDRDDLPAALRDYVSLVRHFNGDARLEQYPGSPGLAQALLRPQDGLRLFELHRSDHRILHARLAKRRNIQVTLGDGFAALKGELPPPSRRGVVLIDPSYEVKTDYRRSLAATREALTRFAQGTVIVWYPQLRILESAQFAKRLQASCNQLAKKGWLHVRLTVRRSDAQGFGLLGCGLFVANPPHTLFGTLSGLMPYLVDVLGQYEGANYLLEQHAL